MTAETPIAFRLRTLAKRITPRVPAHERAELLYLADQVEALEAEQYIPVLEPKIRED